MRNRRIIESDGQKIRYRKTNKPYDPKEDKLVKNKLNREVNKVEKLNQLRKKEIEKEIKDWLRYCNELAYTIDEYNYEVKNDDFWVEQMYTFIYKDLTGDDYEGCDIQLSLDNDFEPEDRCVWIGENTKINVTYVGWGFVDGNTDVIPLEDADIEQLQEYGDVDFVPCYRIDLLKDPYIGGDFVIFNDEFTKHTDVETILQTPVPKGSLTFQWVNWTLNFENEDFSIMVNSEWERRDVGGRNVLWFYELDELEYILKCAEKVAKKW